MSSIYILSTVLVVSGAPVVLGNSGLSGLLHSVNNAVQEHLPIQHSSMFGIEESYAGMYFLSRCALGIAQGDWHVFTIHLRIPDTRSFLCVNS